MSNKPENAVAFARRELEKYFRMMTGRVPGITLEVDRELFRSARPVSFDPDLDDAWSARVDTDGLRVCGSNERSVLLGAYRLLNALGCRFLSPAPDGEIVPRIDADAAAAAVEEIPPNRYRTICIEGSVRPENVIGMLDWGAKNGFNGYFIQFDRGEEFYRRWFAHAENPFKSAEPFSDADARSFAARVDGEIAKRGFSVENKGHGWTGAAIGALSVGWQSVSDSEISGEARELLAEVGGKRRLWGGVPANTNLCYSDPRVRAKIAELVADYAQSRGDVDILHVWLADAYNNHCECPACRAEGVSDLYVRLLNEIDARMTEAGLRQKIAFLAYFELLEPPLRERIKSPDRFVFMFAPVARNYYTSWKDALPGEEREEKDYFTFAKNAFRCLTSNESQLVYLKKWKQVFAGDSFVFDYYLCADLFRDFGQMRLARTIYEDVSSYRAMGVNGLNSCQVQRAFFPCGFTAYVMGRSLIGGETFEEIAREYFAAAFGQSGREIAAALQRLSDLTPHAYLRFETDDTDAGAARALGELERALPDISAQISACRGESPLQKKNLRALRLHAEILSALVPLLRRRAEGESREQLLKIYRESVKPMIYANEDEYQYEWDTDCEDGICTIWLRDAWKALPSHFSDIGRSER